MKERLKLLEEKIKDFQAERVKKNDFEYWTMENPVDFLDWCVENNFLLHGSPQKITDKLTPNEPQNAAAKSERDPFGTYFSLLPQESIFYSLLGPKTQAQLGDESSKMRVSLDNFGKINARYENISFYLGDGTNKNLRDKGYIYVVDFNAFSQQEKEQVTKGLRFEREILPILTVQVSKQDFKEPLKPIKKASS